MTNPNEPAFPEVQPLPQFNSHTYGLTKREYFAVLAMQGLLANPVFNHKMGYRTIAEESCRYADVLVDALNQPKQ